MNSSTSRRLVRTLQLALALSVLGGARTASAQYIRTDAGFGSTVTPRNDDYFFAGVDAGFTMHWEGLTTSAVGVNNNGYVALGGGGGIVPCAPTATCSSSLFSAFNADLDSRHPDTSPMTYGTSTVDGHAAFGMNWLNFGYYSNGAPGLNFQIVLIDRSDVSAGDFDVEFNYGDLAAIPGRPVYAGWTAPSAYFALPGSGTDGAANELANSRWLFESRNGTIDGGTRVVASTTTPEPGTWALMGTGLVGLAGVTLRRRRSA